MKPQKAIMFWSSGKDSAYALWQVQKMRRFEVVALVTTLNEDTQRVAIHETPEVLVKLQAHSLGIPLVEIYLPSKCPNSVYEEKILNKKEEWLKQGINHLIFGDLFLKEIRAYREKLLSEYFKLEFPLWNRNTLELANEIIDSGLKAVITAVDIEKLNTKLIGTQFDHALVQTLVAEGVDPCGENGEFHTFVYHAPNFKNVIHYEDYWNI